MHRTCYIADAKGERQAGSKNGNSCFNARIQNLKNSKVERSAEGSWEGDLRDPCAMLGMRFLE